MKTPRIQYKVDNPKADNTRDDWQTPYYAVEPLVKYIPKHVKCIWEPCAGEMMMVSFLEHNGYNVIATDIKTGYNFLSLDILPVGVDCIITNPPYSIKDDVIRKCISFGLPWALLLPLTSLGEQGRFEIWKETQPQVIIMDKRLNYIYNGVQSQGSHMPTIWVTNGFNLPRDLVYERVKDWQ